MLRELYTEYPSVLKRITEYFDILATDLQSSIFEIS
jgi:hypothetical protein